MTTPAEPTAGELDPSRFFDWEDEDSIELEDSGGAAAPQAPEEE